MMDLNFFQISQKKQKFLHFEFSYYFSLNTISTSFFKTKNKKKTIHIIS